MCNCPTIPCKCGKASGKLVVAKSLEISLDNGRSIRTEIFEDPQVITMQLMDGNYRPEFVVEVTFNDIQDFTELFRAVGREIAQIKRKEENNG